MFPDSFEGVLVAPRARRQVTGTAEDALLERSVGLELLHSFCDAARAGETQSARPTELQGQDYVFFIANLRPVIGTFRIIGELAFLNPAVRSVIHCTTDAIADLIKIVPMPWPRELAFLLSMDQTKIVFGVLIAIQQVGKATIAAAGGRRIFTRSETAKFHSQLP